MPTPTTNVTLSSIQTEFGGVNPISLSEYYRGSGTGYVPSGQTTSGTDGNPISTSGTVRIGMFRGLTKTVAGGIAPTQSFPDVDGTYYVIPGEARSVFANFESNGQVRGYRHGNVLIWTLNWFTPTTTGIGSSYWLRATLLSGEAPSGGMTLGAWVSLNSTPGSTYSVGSNGVYQSRSGTVRYDVSATNGGSVISSWTIYYYVDRDSS